MAKPLFLISKGRIAMAKKAKRGNGSAQSAEPVMVEEGREMQSYGQMVTMHLGLSKKVCADSVEVLNGILADTMTLRDLYKKHHWQISGPAFYQLHLLYDKHFEEQSELVDEIAERIQLLGGISVAMAADVAELTGIERPPQGREAAGVQVTRLVKAHERILIQARKAGSKADEAGDCGTNDLLVSSVVRTNELQVWFVSEHLVPLMQA